MQNLDKPSLGGLERQINILLQRLHQLRLENNQLRHRLTHAQQIETTLDEKNKRAQEKMMALITRLKEELI